MVTTVETAPTYWTNYPFLVFDLLKVWREARYLPVADGEVAAMRHYDSQARLSVPLSADRIIAPLYLHPLLKRALAAVEDGFANDY